MIGHAYTDIGGRTLQMGVPLQLDGLVIDAT